jgi:lauroyl/myristoyl acyltransferase
LSMFISRHTPPALGYRLASLLAGMVCRFKPAVYHIVRANLSQVLDPDAGEAVLHQTTREVFYTATRSYYDLYRAMQLPPEEMVATVELTEGAQAVARSTWDSEAGTVIVFAHLGNFDLGGPALAAHLQEIQLFSLPNPPAGFQMANEMRRGSGLIVTPLCPAAIRQAIRRLKAGGVVGVAGDRPVSDLDEPVPFFGRPARVPSGHVRLALRTGANIVMAYIYLSSETQEYILHIDPPLELIRTGDRNEEIRLNMRLVLDELEAIIRRWPSQWQMFVPLWPEQPEA